MKQFTFFLQWAKQQYRNLLLAILLVFIDVWLSVQLPYLMSVTISQSLGAGDVDAVRLQILRMLLFAFGSSVFGFISSVLTARAAQRFGNDLRSAFFTKVMSMPFVVSLRFESGILITRLTGDIQILSQYLAFLVQSVWRPLVILSLSLWNMGRLGSNLPVWIAVIAALLVVMFFIMRKLTDWFREIQIHFEKVNSLLKRTLRALRAIKVWSREPWEENRFAAENDRLLTLNIRIQSFMAVVNPLLMLIVSFSIIAVLMVSGEHIHNGSTTVGNVLALIIYAQQLMLCVVSLGQLFELTVRTGVSAKRVAAVLDVDSTFASGNASVPEGPAPLCVDSVSFAYSQESPEIIHDVNLCVQPGKDICIVGPTGSGKTTLCMLLARIIDPSSGSINLGDTCLQDYALHGLRRKIAYVPQVAELAPVSIAENIAYGFEGATKEDIVLAAKAARADDFITKLPNGYEEQVLQNGSSLSGGQRQRIILARALVRRPGILILDDCFTAMDMETERAVRAALKTCFPELTIISVTQRLTSVSQFDRIVVISDGRVVSEGDHESLMSTSEVYREIYMSQRSEVIE